jgi:hypothetical protein
MMLVSFTNNTTGTTSWAETVYLSGASEFNPGFSGFRVSKDRQYHGNHKKDKRWSTTHYTETKHWETRNPEKPGLNSDAPER